MKRIYLIIMGIMACYVARSQQWTMQAGYSDAGIQGLYSVNASTLIANGEKMILRSEDGGASWISASTDNKKYQMFVKPSFINKNTGWSAAYVNVLTPQQYTEHKPFLLKTDDGGKSWHAEATAGLNALSKPQYIHFFNSEEAVLAGTNADGTLIIYRTDNGGLSWQKKYGAEDLYEILDGQFVNASTGNLVTWNAVIKTTDGGNTWEVKYPELNQENSEALQRVSFSSPTEGWVSGNDALFKTSNGGESWTRVSGTGYDPYTFIAGLHFFDFNHGFISSSTGSLKYTADGGATWETSNVAAAVVDLIFLDAQMGYVAGQYPDVIARTDDRAVRWENKFSIPPVSQALFDIAFMDLQHGVAVGDMGLITHTADGGKHWTEVSNPATDEGYNLFAIAHQNDQTLWAAGQQNTLLKSVDGGLNWQAQQGLPLFYYDLRDIFFAKGTTKGWAVGDYFKIMHFDGSTWTNHARTGEKFRTLESVFFINETTGWIVGEDGIILKTTDGGITWNDLNSGVLRKFNDVFFVDENIGWVVGDNDYILKTVDGGVNWHQQNLPHAFVGNMQAVYFSSPHRGWIAGSDERRGAIYSTVDGGNEWKRVLPYFGNSMQGMYFHDLNHGWVVSGEPDDGGGNIFRYTGSDTGSGDASPAIRSIDFEPLTDTLFNFNIKAKVLKDSTKYGGMFIGRNGAGIEEFAEKYYIEGEAWVTGVITHHSGTVSNTRNVAEFNVFNIDAQGMPDRKLRRKDKYFGDIDLSGKAMVTMFDKPVAVSDSFFVAFNLTDYSHGGFEGDVLGVLHTSNNTRPLSDIASRNVIRMHDHYDREWRSARTSVVTSGYSGYLGIFPIIQYELSSDAKLKSLSSTPGTLHPLFSPETLNYTVHLPHGTNELPLLSFQVNHSGAIATYTPAASVTGSDGQRTAFIKVTAKDGTINTYTVVFKVAENGLDTLKNHAPNAPLEAMRYNKAQGWGYILGHNYMFRQQYAEKYYITGNAEVNGVIAHLKGRYAHADTLSEFNVFNVSDKHIPGTRLGGKKVPYKDLKLNADPTTILFDKSIAVADSFYVSFNLFDYAHGGYEGDTIGMYMSKPGSRPVTDFQIKGRNVVQRHNHEFTDWVDFRTQNFTPFAVHFALYPIVKFIEDVPTGIEEQYIEQGSLRLFPAYPNPAKDNLHIKYAIGHSADISIQVVDVKGNNVMHHTLGLRRPDLHDEVLDISLLTPGMYIYIVHAGKVSLASRFIVER